MEKSIEVIWNEGFLREDALIAPRINNLYDQKSIHLVDRIERMFQNNLRGIVIGAFLFLGLSSLLGMSLMGIGYFIILTVIYFINRHLAKGLKSIDKNTSSYQYIKNFERWMLEMVAINKRMARFYYPAFFICTIVGFWVASFRGRPPLGEIIMEKLLSNIPDMHLLFGLPLIGIFTSAVVVILLAVFAGSIYQWDFNIIYGGVMRKLEEIIDDMEELRK